MKGKVENVTPSKSGKAWRVQIGGKFYGANFASKLDSAVGKVIDFDFDDGKFGPWVKTWAPVGGEAQEAAMAPMTYSGLTGANIPPSPLLIPKANGDRFWLPFASNTVAHAITAGLIKTPADLNQWAKAAHDAAVALDTL